LVCYGEVVLKINFMDSLTSLHDFLSNATNFLNGVLFLELVIACICGMQQGFWLGEASTDKIIELALYTAMLFGAWQWWPHQLVLLTVVPQLALFWVFAGGLVGCTLRWGVERSFLRG
jgi:hypothetical protein